MEGIELTENQLVFTKFGNVAFFSAIGKDCYCVGSGCNLRITSISTGNETSLYCNDEENGHGIDCLIGNRILDVFAYAEAVPKPRIFVRSYPDFDIIHILTDGSLVGYSSMVFTESDYFLALGKYPDFVLTVWNWRTGMKLSSKTSSSIHCDNQMIKCSYTTTMPFSVVHLGLSMDKVSVWDILACGNKCILMEHETELRVKIKHVAGTPKRAAPYFTSAFFTSDGGCFVANSHGAVFTTSFDHYLDEVISPAAVGEHNTFVCWFMGGILIFGPDASFRHYKKSGDWELHDHFDSSYAYKKLLSYSNNCLLGLTTTQDVMIFSRESNSFVSTNKHEHEIITFVILNPIGEHVITLSPFELSCWDIETGQRIDTMLLTHKALALSRSPEYPYVAVGYENGLLELVSVYEPSSMKVMANFHLSHAPIDRIYFTQIGKLIVTANMKQGEFFVIEGSPGSKMKVIAHATGGRQVADYIIVASQTCLRLFAINVTSDRYIAGNEIVRHCIIAGKNPSHRIYRLENSEEMLTKLCATTRLNRDRVFYAIPMSRRVIYELETKRGEYDAKIIRVHPLNHQMRKLRLYVDSYHFVTSAYDGLIFVYDKAFDHVKYTLNPHHRMFDGIKRAACDPQAQYVVSMGRDGTLSCNKITNVKINQQLQTQLAELKTSKRLEVLFKSKTEGYCPKGELEGKTWVEAEEYKRAYIERIQCEDRRNSILVEFESIRVNVQELLTNNLEGPDNERLDMQEFNMDLKLKSKVTEESNELCKNTKIYLEALIAAQDKVTKWIKNNYWDKMSEQGKAIWAIFGNFDVQNYVLLPDDGEKTERARIVRGVRELENLLASEDSFEPWLPSSEEAMKLILEKSPNIANEIMKSKSMVPEDEDEEEDGSETRRFDMETFTAFAGSITHTFIHLDDGQYNQYQLQSYNQSGFQIALSEMETIKLKQFLNKEFENMRSLKEREMYNVLERNARLRYILSELNYFNNDIYQVQVTDPDWKQTEDPQKILIVEDNEVGISPYISPSRQALLNAEAAEAERLRLSMLADDFKERALMAMMNGVLEIRWEDELRKDVPVPKCMIEKEPENFGVEDLQAIREYENQVKFLLSERERYRKILEAEYAKVGNYLREGVKKFNGRLQDLLLLKIKVDSAVEQENLKINRLLLNNVKRRNLNEEENHNLKRMLELEKEIERIHKMIHSFQETLKELKTNLDGLQVKEKLLEKTFKREFVDANQVLQETLYKQYRKRPKTNIRNIASVAILNELSKALITRQHHLMLNLDATDYLKALDNLDSYVGIPVLVDEVSFQNMCRHRRLKIESEIKIKAFSVGVTECETSITLLNKFLQSLKDIHSQDAQKVIEIRNKKILKAQDIEVQIVLKEGFVEVLRTGKLSDFENAIMIPRKEVEDINRIILLGGNQKLRTIRNNMHFHRTIMRTEWEHARMKMRIADLNQYIADILSVKVTKEIQAFLKSRARGEPPEKQLTFEQEIEIVRKGYEREIMERKERVREVQKAINKVKADNKELDIRISNVNVDVCECKLNFDENYEKKEREIIRTRMATLLKRARLVKDIQNKHNEILVLQTELELLRLKTYPSLKYKVNN